MGFSRFQIRVLGILSIICIVGFGFKEWDSRKPLKKVDPEYIKRFEIVADSLNKHSVRENDEIKKTANKYEGLEIDINTATAKELEKLPGIGPKLAERILTHRNVHGHFSSIDELKKVKGIGEIKLLNIKSYVVLRSISQED